MMKDKRILWSSGGLHGYMAGAVSKAQEIAAEYISGPRPRVPTHEGLLADLRSALLLTPIRIGKLQHMKLFEPKSVRLQSGRYATRRVAEARFGFSGSEALWSIDPGLGQPFPYRAVFAITSLGFRTLIEGTDLGAFEADALHQAEILEHLLPNLDGRVGEVNRWVEPRLYEVADRWFSPDPASSAELAAWPTAHANYKAVLADARRRPRKR